MSEFCGRRTSEGRTADYPSFPTQGDGTGICRDAVETVYEDYYASVGAGVGQAAYAQ